MDKHEAARVKARELVTQGMSRMQAAKAIGYSIDFVNRACSGLPGNYRTVHGKAKNAHVPPDDECNVQGFWVPTLEEIAKEKARLRAGLVQVHSPRTAQERAQRMDSMRA